MECEVWGITKENLAIFSSVQSLGCVQLFATPWTAAFQALILAPGVFFQILRSLHPWALLYNALSSDELSCSVLSNSL